MTRFPVREIFGPVGPKKWSYAIDPHLRSDHVGAVLRAERPTSAHPGPFTARGWSAKSYNPSLRSASPAAWRRDGKPVPYYPSVGVADSSPDFIRQRRMRGAKGHPVHDRPQGD